MDTGGPMDGLTADQCHGYASRSDGSLVRVSAEVNDRFLGAGFVPQKKFVGFLRWVLPARRERPRSRRAAEQRDELASSHYSITSSASANSLSGTSRPSALAVLRTAPGH
jgi:hypothetical protein